MAMISLLVCSRISGNKNFSLPRLLKSLERMSSNYDNFEVLIKFDSDDKKVQKLLPSLETYPFTIKYMVEPRGRGYCDLHIFYNRLFSQVDEKSIIIGAVADDFEIIQLGWDEIILSKTNIFPDQIFIIHGRPHPPYQRDDYEQQKFSLDFDINSLEDLHIIDEAPLWSRKVMEICGGFLNETDCWALLLEYFLWHRCGINRTIFLDQPFSYRNTRDDVDQQIAPRWWTDRAWIFDLLRSNFYKSLVEQQAVNIYCNIKMAEMSALPPPFAQKESDFKPTVSTKEEIRRLNLRYRVFQLKMMVFNLLPGFMRPAVTKLYRTLNQKQAVLDLFPSFMRPGLIKLYYLYSATKILPRALYLRLSFIPCLTKTKQEHTSIMCYLDRWVSKHSVKGYVPEDFIPTETDVSAENGIQQVRREISEFVMALLIKGLDNSILEIGLGYHGGTHMLWRQIFKRVVTIEANPWLVKKLRLSEWLDSRSVVIVGRSEDRSTLEKIRNRLDSVDVLFIDGDHTYESIASDWAIYHNLVRPGGIVAFHDSVCTLPRFGATKFLEDLSKGIIDGKCYTLHNIVYSDHVGITYIEC